MNKKTVRNILIETEKIKSGLGLYSVVLNKHLKLIGNHFVIADMHLPHLDYDWYLKFIYIVKKFKNIDKLLIIGDLMDFESISTFYQCLNENASMKNDIAMTREVLTNLFKYFKTINWVIGNHDKRFFVKFNKDMGIMELKDLLRMNKENLIISPYPYCYIESNGVKFRCTHPRTYSRNSGYTARALAVKYRCSIINTHNHFYSVSNDFSGEDVCVDLGVMCDGNRIYYRQLSDTNHPVWNSGFGLIKDGSFFGWCKNPKITNWDFWERVKI